MGPIANSRSARQRYKRSILRQRPSRYLLDPIGTTVRRRTPVQQPSQRRRHRRYRRRHHRVPTAPGGTHLVETKTYRREMAKARGVRIARLSERLPPQVTPHGYYGHILALF